MPACVYVCVCVYNLLVGLFWLNIFTILFSFFRHSILRVGGARGRLPRADTRKRDPGGGDSSHQGERAAMLLPHIEQQAPWRSAF